MKRLAMPLLLLAGAARADVVPSASPDDPRIGVIHMETGGAASLQAAAGTDLTLLLPRGETVQQVIVGDANVWHVLVPAARDAVVLSALRAASPTGLSIRGSRKSYELLLTATRAPARFYMVRLEDGAGPAKALPPPVEGQGATYRLSGSKELFPSAIRDDGRKIYLQWSASQPIPAVFALNRLGREEMIDGYMRDGIFTLDRIYDTLVFRIDKAQAHARRIPAKAEKP